MPRRRSPDSKKAETLYRKGMKLSEIAEKLGVPAGRVRRWKSEQKWDEDKENEPEKRSEINPETERFGLVETERKPNARRKGAQPENVNSIGNQGGAPDRNQNALVHGAYSKVYEDVLMDDEKELAQHVPKDEETLLEDQIVLFTLRERRILKAINKYRAIAATGDGSIAKITLNSLRSERQREFDGTPEEQAKQKALYDMIIKTKVEGGDRLPGRDVQVTTTTENADEIIMRLERELTSVQSQKTKAINALAQLRQAKRKDEADGKGNELVRAWAESLRKRREEQDG